MRRLLSFILICATALLPGCSSVKKNQELSKQTIAEFHQKMNNGDAAAVYDSASEEFKKAVTRDAWTKLALTVTKKAGKYASSGDPSVFVNWSTNGTFVTATCESKFEKGTATEEFRFINRNDRLELLAYHVQSPLLLE